MTNLFKKFKVPQKGTGCNFRILILGLAVWGAYEIIHPLASGLF